MLVIPGEIIDETAGAGVKPVIKDGELVVDNAKLAEAALLSLSSFPEL